ncbi:hypothetical protein LOZ53_003276 [Ophidiomyces ophidiicola]|nr:hypothetical protein LOZ55_000752 [Ophidiomyces ophidiicola]KAI1990278.1 hypothetical protein LOZ53_003276 [Ophidiomyces ophidiicola]KAI1990919.1 hypothetical protein LOZ54_002311 [Ophidiomyces ophidiicola]KAI1998082.1 hypothetical protein LOZ51_002759 [Ophidiomyces ophidiicola]
MAGNVDFRALKARAIDSGIDEEAVTVNTRALIDKVLARYSGEWTVLRELLQNAADASATRVIVKLETIPSVTVPTPSTIEQSLSLKHIISHHTIKSLIVKNNGFAFNSNDWSRLKRIAEGNPDETKIGAFGVGFYSVFSDCEEPFVSSGKEAIAFYWKGNSLFTRRLQLQEQDCSPDTTFVLEYRNTTSPVPSLLPLAQFLASSLTFIGLQTIELWLDNWKLLHLTKKVAPGVPVSIPRDIQTSTSEGLMNVNDVTQEIAQIDATWMPAVEWKSPTNSSRFEGTRSDDNTGSLRSFFSRLTRAAGNKLGEKSSDSLESPVLRPPEDLVTPISSSVFLHINTARVQTAVGHSFGQELLRATKKPAPKFTSLAILTSSFISMEIMNGSVNRSPKSIFTTVLPHRSGKIYIGFSTHQTTGLNAHISAPSLIPTVERESIDLNARWVRTWNTELLRAAGIVCRIAWSAEMASIDKRISSSASNAGKTTPPLENISAVIPEVVHLSNQFVFGESTPSSQVGQVLENSFWTCNKNAYLELLSTCGVLPSYKIRLAPKDLSFMKSLPVVPDLIMEQSKDFITKLIDFGLLTEITVSDIKQELESSPVTAQQLGEFLLWLSGKASNGSLNQTTVKALLSVVVANDESSKTQSGIICLNDIKWFLDPARVPTDLPIPQSVLPFHYTRNLSRSQLTMFGWRELPVDILVHWLIESDLNGSLPLEHCITRTASFSSRILPLLSKQFDTLSQPSKMELITLLKSHTVIPTKSGIMKRPPETYFPSVRLFADLPIVHGLNNVKEKFLINLGVRKTVELNVIFERLLNTPIDSTEKMRESQWSHVELIKYLTSVQGDIPRDDIAKLKQASICTAEHNKTSARLNKRYKVCELFEPKNSLRDLELPLLHWPGNYSSSSSEAKFLSLLGLKAFPSAAELIQLISNAASQKRTDLREKALAYFISTHVINGYANFDYTQVTTPFLPGNDGLQCIPSQCFTDTGALLFGFKLLRSDLGVHASKFGIKQHPPINDCLGIMLRDPPKSLAKARELFEYFAQRLAEINASTAERIGMSPIVPLHNAKNLEGSSLSGHIAPQDCYLGNSNDYADIFSFVDFGPKGNLFLMACGSKQEPTSVELGVMLVKNSAVVLSHLQNPDKYLRFLRSIADNIDHIKKHKNLFRDMKKASFLLASKELPNQTKKDEAEDLNEDEELPIKEWQLIKATDAVIVDDYTSFNLFKDTMLAAPQEETLEDLYAQLGSPTLSSIIVEEARCGQVVPNQHNALKLQKQIHERAKIFLHDVPKDQIKHDAKWLEKYLVVQVVQSISLRRSLRGRNTGHIEKRHAIVTRGPNKPDPILSISPGDINFYQVSQVLVHTILSRPKLHSSLTLEMLLKTDLLELRARGYNVERILRQKDAAARIAKTHQQQRQEQQLEEDRSRLVKTAEKGQLGQDVRPDGYSPHPMPGVFPESRPDQVPNITQSSLESNRGMGGFISDLGRRFGLEEIFRNNGTASTPPSPHSQQPENKVDTAEPHSLLSNDNLQQNLSAAIARCRPHGHAPIQNPGQVTQITDAKSYCDERPALNLVYVTNIADTTIRFFQSPTDEKGEGFYSRHANGLHRFAVILIDCAGIFGVRKDSIAVFHEMNGNTIAFNHGGSIFCNYDYFQRLHLKTVTAGNRSDCLVYWWTIFCHELAHNLIGPHNSEHGYYTESFVMKYLPAITALLQNSNTATPTQKSR